MTRRGADSDEQRRHGKRKRTLGDSAPTPPSFKQGAAREDDGTSSICSSDSSRYELSDADDGADHCGRGADGINGGDDDGVDGDAAQPRMLYECNTAQLHFEVARAYAARRSFDRALSELCVTESVVTCRPVRPPPCLVSISHAHFQDLNRGWSPPFSRD